MYQSAVGAQSIECARLLNEQLYVSGAQDGTLALWMQVSVCSNRLCPCYQFYDPTLCTLISWRQTKKKAIAQVPNAHGGSWITSLGCLPYTDVLASGSSDGAVRIWQAVTSATGSSLSSSSSAQNSLRQLKEVPVVGYVNALSFARASGRFLLAGVGQEHRMGRWTRIPAARNGVHLITLPH